MIAKILLDLRAHAKIGPRCLSAELCFRGSDDDDVGMEDEVPCNARHPLDESDDEGTQNNTNLFNNSLMQLLQNAYALHRNGSILPTEVLDDRP